ncbi:MAG: hypothetical protein K8U57_04055 [Planctomycetes bacterium]|nr:hypothetical protein [Planctomycetota bacterium]
MTRMSREFSLVLLGAGLLTAGYFAWPEPDFEKRADEQAARRTGTRTGGSHILFIGHFGGGSGSVSGGGRSAAFASVSKGGLGSIGGRVSGGGG